MDPLWDSLEAGHSDICDSKYWLLHRTKRTPRHATAWALEFHPDCRVAALLVGLGMEVIPGRGDGSPGIAVEDYVVAGGRVS
jgi:hypothetical protein